LCRGQEGAPSRGRGDSAPARRHERGADRVGEAMHDGADGWLRHAQPFCRAPHVLLLQDRHGDGELRTDYAQPFNIWIKHIRKSIGLINGGCGIVTLTDRTIPRTKRGTTMTTDTNNSVKAMLRGGQFITAPGVFDLVSAKIADRTTAPAIYMTGYGVVASYLGQPDAGLATYTDMLNRADAIVDAIHKPLIADGDTGYGGLLNVAHTVRGYEKAGVAVIQIEDQHFPKKCGHTPNRHVVPTQEMVNKIKVASDARSSADFLILARTDALTSLGLDEALRRGEAYANAGADILFIEAPESKEQMRTIGAAFDVPVLSNQTHGGITPILPPAELAEMGFAAAIYPTVGLFAASHALASVYQALAQGKPVSDPLYAFADFVDMIGFPKVWEFEKTYADLLAEDQI
jgi:2-methylisocitrate lyase-like PEP mutase family enzyme